MPKKQYYFDHAATTPTDPKVFSAMLPYFKKEFGNPSNLYKLGRNAEQAVLKSTGIISEILDCRPAEFFYTGSATESDNLALVGVARANKEKGNRIIISNVEHKGVLAVCETLEKEGFEIVKLPVLKNGLVDLAELKKELNEKTILVSVTMADSETGTLQPITEISKIIKNFRRGDDRPYLHTDASQAAGYLDLDVDKLGVDLMTLSAHKIYGPKGVAGLYVKRGVKIDRIILGTQNVPGIVGFAEALKLNSKNKRKENARIKKMRDSLEKGIFKLIPKTILNGHPDKRLPNFLNVSFLDVEGEAMLLYLDELGIMVGTGSACNSKSLSPSSVLLALGNPYEYIHGSIRFTLGKDNTMENIKYVLKHLPIVVKKLRQISSLDFSLNRKKWQNKIKK